MRAVIKEGKLKKLLDEVVVNNLHRGQHDTQSRPWHIVFSDGYYGKFHTAFCELEGSPVKAQLVINIDNTNFVPTSSQGKLIVADTTWSFKKTYTSGTTETGRTAKIIQEIAALRDKLLKQTNKKNNDN